MLSAIALVIICILGFAFFKYQNMRKKPFKETSTIVKHKPIQTEAARNLRKQADMANINNSIDISPKDKLWHDFEAFIDISVKKGEYSLAFEYQTWALNKNLSKNEFISYAQEFASKYGLGFSYKKIRTWDTSHSLSEGKTNSIEVTFSW